MKKSRTSFLKRFIAMAVALVLTLTCANLGAILPVFAVTNDEVTVNVGAIVAGNYDLTEAEKDLLKSGYLAGGTISYTVPTNEDNLVDVDTETKTITAKQYKNWSAVEAYIIVSGDKKENVALTDGEGNYTYDGNAFSVQVKYALNTTVSEEVQGNLLNTAGWLKDGLKSTADIAGVSGSLYALEMAMPELVNLAENGIKGFKPGTIGREAIGNLNKQMQANNGKLELSASIAAYKAGSAVQYVLTKGSDMKEQVEELLKSVSDLKDQLDFFAGMLDTMLQNSMITEDEFNKVNVLIDVVADLENSLKSADSVDWTAAEKGTALVSDNVDYAELDKLVAALGELTAMPTIINPLKVAETTVQENLSMWNVTVSVVLKTVQDNEIIVADTKTVTLTLAEGAATEEILAAVAEDRIEQNAITAWGEAFVAGQYEATKSELPETLTEDITYTITYSPVNYTVDIAGAVNNYPYGYVVTLPVHTDGNQSYDYFDAYGNYHAQGTEILVDKNMTFTRSVGKAYTTGKLLAVLANNYAGENAKVNAILTSGALNVDETFSYRKPSADELDNLVTLNGNVLKAETYPSSYNGLSWAADTYEVDGVSYEFNGQTTVTISDDFDEVYVYYSLVLTNYSESEVDNIFDLVITLNDEAEGQLSVLNKLAGYGDQMSILDMTTMQGLQAMVKNEEMKAIIGEMMARETGCFDAEGNLILNNIIAGYNDANNGGLYYYYTNDAFVRGEVDKLSGFMNRLLGKEEYKEEIRNLLGTMGQADKADKLDDLSAKLEEVSKDLVAKNEAIVVSDAGALRKLADALALTGDVAIATYGSPYISMEPVFRAAEKYVTVTVNVTVNGTSNTTPITAKVLKGETLSAAQVAELKAAVEAFVVASGINTKYYENNYNAAELDALAVNALETSMTFEYEWVKAQYSIEVPGAANQYVDIDNLTITLPAHPNAMFGMSYEYTIDGKTASAGIFTLTPEQLDKLIAGELEITRIEKNEATEKLIKMVNAINKEMGYVALTLVEKDGVYTGINVNMGMKDMMNFVMGLVMNSGYNYIGLNNEGFKYATSDGLEISIQTLINAILNDEGFNNDRLIALAQSGKGTVVNTTMQLGNSASEINYSLAFTMNLNSVPAQLTGNVDLIKTVSNYIKFQSKDGIMTVSVNLPDKVYGAYAAALIATGTVDKTNVNELRQQVAIQFVYDYLTAITGSEADMVSFTNTLKMLGLSQDLTAYNKYYTAGIDAYNNYVTVDISDDGAAINVSAPGKASIDALLKLSGAGMDGIEDLLVMLKEYKAGATINASINGTLKNTDKTYYALIVDAQADGLTNKFEAPSSLNALRDQTKSLAGYSAMILLDDVQGDLTVSGTTILDLNGKSVTGNIKATGKLFIIDSSMDTYNAGTVGSVSGNAVVIGGNYNADVSSFLKDGYYMDGKTVRNALYYITDEDGTVTFHLNGDVYENEHVDGLIPNAKALALDIATDLVLNYIYTAKLSVNDYDLIGVDVDDLVGIFADRDVNNLVKQLLNCVTIGEAGYDNEAGFEGLVNDILDDVIDFEAISAALANNTALATYKITTEPWTIELEHLDDYMTVNVGSNSKLSKTFNVALVVESKYNDKLASLIGELGNIVEDRTDIEIDIPTPTYSDKTLTVSGAGKAEAYIDLSENSDYAVIIGTILAYGNSAKRDAVATAINSGNIDDLKEVVDNTSVKELFTALKVMARNVNFQAMANTVGITEDVSSAAELEGLYHLILCGTGKVLEQLDITGRNSKLGNLYNEKTGYYELSKENMFRDAELNIRSYTALVEVTVDILSLNVKIFDDVDTPVGPTDPDPTDPDPTDPDPTDPDPTDPDPTDPDPSDPIDPTDPEHTHGYSKWGYNDEEHWKVCECGEIDESTRAKHEHSIDKNDGYLYCVCGHSIQKNVPGGPSTTGDSTPYIAFVVLIGLTSALAVVLLTYKRRMYR